MRELLEVASSEIAGTTPLSIVVPAKAGIQCRCSNKPSNDNDAGMTTRVYRCFDSNGASLPALDGVCGDGSLASVMFGIPDVTSFTDTAVRSVPRIAVRRAKR